MSEKHSIPEDATTPIRPDDSAAAAPTAPAPAGPVRRSRKRTALIAGGAVLAAAVLAGGGVAIGAAVADENDDDESVSELVERGDAGSPDAGSADAGAALADLGTDSADELIEIAEAAAAAAEGDPVSIDAKRDGAWDVELRTADGAETEVRVAADGTATVRSTEAADADEVPQTVLDAAAIRSIVAAALAESDGRVIDIDADDDGVSPYDVTVVTGDRSVIDIELDAGFAAVATDTDD